MFEGFKALLGSEKALVGGSLVIAATVLVALGHMTVVDWQAYTRDVFYAYVGGKTLTSAVALWTSKPAEIAAPAVPVVDKPADKPAEDKPA